MTQIIFQKTNEFNAIEKIGILRAHADAVIGR
jgi:hypothetical protein